MIVWFDGNLVPDGRFKAVERSLLLFNLVTLNKELNRNCINVSLERMVAAIFTI